MRSPASAVLVLWMALRAQCPAAPGPSTPPPPPGIPPPVQSILDAYCFKCHGETKPKGGVNLARFKDEFQAQRDPKTWTGALRQLRDGDMPPEGKPQPSPGEREQLQAWIERTLENPDPSALPPDPGRVLIHRLNRTEYNNTIRDWLGVNTRPADRFPSDGGGGGGFDNTADTLFIPPILLERYLQAAEDIVAAIPENRLVPIPPSLLRSTRTTLRRNIAHHIRSAFRRPAEPDEINRLLARLPTGGREDSHDSMTQGLRSVIKILLVSPEFIFRIERDQPGAAPYRIRDIELASRLSYFLWSSMPDEPLLRDAEAGRLHQTSILQAQVRRMLKDPKARTLSENFVTQWLAVRNLKTTTRPDAGRFPEYTPDLRDAMVEEPVRLFQSILEDGTSLRLLLDSPYTYLNPVLARHYGLTNLTQKAPSDSSTNWSRVTLPDKTRGGVLGMAGVLTLTSYPLRTSPVLRGRYILEEILGTPPPPPPPLVPGLPPDDTPKDGLSFRQRLELHRRKPECAACHRRLDPLGFGLENFDPIGRWRTDIAGAPVDASAQMTTGEKFSGPVEMKSVLLARRDDFIRNLTEKMLAYALGRGLEYYDTPAVKKISSTLAQDDDRGVRLILEIARSYPFQFRRNPAQEPGQTAQR